VIDTCVPATGRPCYCKDGGNRNWFLYDVVRGVVSKSVCRSYVEWYNENSGDWATWVPGETVAPGDFGSFDKELRFRTLGTISGVETSSRRGPGPRTVFSGGGISFSAKADGKAHPALSDIGDLAGGLTITASRANACFLHLDEVHESWVTNEDEILSRVANGLTEWDLDKVIVMKRLEARRGFAAISKRADASFEVSASVGAAPLGAAGSSLHLGRSRGAFHFYEFGRGSTPVISRIFRVNRGQWHRLLPWRHEGPVLIGPDGRRYWDSGPSPSALMGLPPEDRRYDPRRSAMTPTELSSMAVTDLFELVSSVSGLGEPDQEPAEDGFGTRSTLRSMIAYLPLPVPPRPAALAAADPADTVAPVVQETTGDGRVRLALFDRGGGEWWLEASLTSRDSAPLVLPVLYSTVDGGERELLVPIDDLGGRRMPSSIARLADYAGYEEAWKAANPVSPDAIDMWSPGVLASSVRSSVTEATVLAWERVASAGPPGARPVIVNSLRDLDDQ
jgi:hypothetical protein